MHLRIKENRLTDRALAHIAELDKLETLNLGGPDIGEAGIEHLARLSRLLPRAQPFVLLMIALAVSCRPLSIALMMSTPCC